MEKVLSIVTGEDSGLDRLRSREAYIANMIRKFNLLEGLTPADDRLPKRLHRENLPEGGAFSESEMEQLLADYYRLRGWDS